MVLVGDMGTSCARLGRSGGDRPTYCVHAALGVPATASVAISEDEELHHTYGGGGGSGGGAGGGLGASSVLSPGASMRSSPVKSAIKSAAKSPGKPAGGTSSRPPLRHPPL